jgi:competence protein ComEC
LTFAMLDVSHGSSTLIIFPNGRTALVDTGQHWATQQYVIPFLERHGINRIDTLIITHHHGDHDGGQGQLTQRFGIRDVWDNAWWGGRRVNVGDTFTWNGVRVDVLNTENWANGSDVNQNSLSFRLEYNGFVYTHGGDIYAAQQDRILRERAWAVRSHVYNTNHHLHGSVSRAYLKAADPFVFVTSAEGAVCERSAYTSDYRSVVDDLQWERRRLVGSLLTLDVGNVVVHAWSGTDFRYGTCEDTGSGTVRGLQLPALDACGARGASSVWNPNVGRHYCYCRAGEADSRYPGWGWAQDLKESCVTR